MWEAIDRGDEIVCNSGDLQLLICSKGSSRSGSRELTRTAEIKVEIKHFEAGNELRGLKKGQKSQNSDHRWLEKRALYHTFECSKIFLQMAYISSAIDVFGRVCSFEDAILLSNRCDQCLILESSF